MSSRGGWDGKLAEVLWSRDPAAIASMVEREFGYAVSSHIVAKWLYRMARPADGWSDASVRTWLKLRLDEWYPFPPGMQDYDVRLGIELNVFPLGWHTTPEQLARLKRDETPVPDSTARSGISRCDLVEVTPIDTVARRVTS